MEWWGFGTQKGDRRKYLRIINESPIYKKFHLMCFIMKINKVYTAAPGRNRDAVFLLPCCIAAGCSPEK